LVRNLAAVISVGAVIMSVTNGVLNLGPLPVLINLAIPIFILAAVMRIQRTGRFTGAFLLMIVCIILILFPVAFFAIGGVAGPVPYYFLIGIAVTALMLQGLRFYLAVGLELVVFVGCMWFALAQPWSVVTLPMEQLERTAPICLLTIAVQIALVVHSIYRFYLRTALQLENSNERLREAAKNKDAFLAMAAHELKTPMAIMSTHAQEASRILASLPDPSPASRLVQRDVEIMMNQAESLSAMVTQLLDISRINEGRLTMSIKPIALAEVVQEALAECAPLCAQNGNLLRLARGGAHPTVLGDGARLERVLINLIANATRHTKGGEIILSVSTEGPFARITVEDTGEGMTSESLAAALAGDLPSAPSYAGVRAVRPLAAAEGQPGTLPDPAQVLAGDSPLPDAADPATAQSPTAASGSPGGGAGQAVGVSWPVPVAAGSRHGGLGLGLRIVRHTVEAHGGVFTLKSELGQGTKASFTIPLADQPPKPPTAWSEPVG
jgi:signal transduction histidine kinase